MKCLLQLPFPKTKFQGGIRSSAKTFRPELDPALRDAGTPRQTGARPALQERRALHNSWLRFIGTLWKPQSCGGSPGGSVPAMAPSGGGGSSPPAHSPSLVFKSLQTTRGTGRNDSWQQTGRINACVRLRTL